MNAKNKSKPQTNNTIAEEDDKIVFKIQEKPTRIRWSMRSVFRCWPASRARQRPVVVAAFARALSALFALRQQRHRPFLIRAFAMSSSSEVHLYCRRLNRKQLHGVARTVCPTAKICMCGNRNTVRWRASVVLRDSFVLYIKVAKL